MSFSNGARQSSNDTSQSRSVADADGIRKRSNAKASSGVQAFFTIICTYNRILESMFQVARVRLEQRGFSSMSVNPTSGGPMSCSLVSLRGYLPNVYMLHAGFQPVRRPERLVGCLPANA